MKYIFVVFALFLAATQISTGGEYTPKTSERVIQGKPAVNGQFPHMVWLGNCGGSLISPQWVLTASHCVTDSSTPQVSMGDVIISESPIQVIGNKIHKHPEQDIALVGLDTPVPISDKVKPIRLPNDICSSNAEEIATLSGFGAIDNNGHLPERLQYVNVKVLSRNECKTYLNYIQHFVVCTSGLQNISQGPCFGDSGSGLIVGPAEDPVLIGITSFFYGNSCEIKAMAGYIRPNHFLDWINEITGLDF